MMAAEKKKETDNWRRVSERFKDALLLAVEMKEGAVNQGLQAASQS